MPRDATAIWRPAGAVDWLALAAAPSFLLMAALSSLPAEGALGALCSDATGTGITGMGPMYVLMSVFHAPPWLRLLGLNGGASR
jgi:hypothetical protein